MKTLYVQTSSAELDVRTSLTSVIADWATAQPKFISGMSEKFADLCPLRAEHFSASLSGSFGGNQCKCELFGGACNIFFGPDQLAVAIRNFIESDYPLIGEIIRRSWEWIRTDFDEHGPDLSTFEAREHVKTSSIEAIEAYLEQFTLTGAVESIEAEPIVIYAPSPRVVLFDEQGVWKLRRFVEHSEMAADHLYVNTNVQIRLSALGVQDPFDLIRKLDGLADATVGLHYEDT